MNEISTIPVTIKRERHRKRNKRGKGLDHNNKNKNDNKIKEDQEEKNSSDKDQLVNKKPIHEPDNVDVPLEKPNEIKDKENVDIDNNNEKQRNEQEEEEEIQYESIDINDPMKRRYFIRCDLCNEEIQDQEDVEVHIELHHATLRTRCSNLLIKQRNEILMTNIPPEHIKSLGVFLIENVVGLDKGKKAFEVIQHSVIQINEIIRFSIPWAYVFPFGSCVAAGSWDGVGDADFTVLGLQYMRVGQWPPINEKGFILEVSRSLRKAGFLFNELEPIIHTRVPIVKRAQKERTSLRLRNEKDEFQIVYKFNKPPYYDISQKLVSSLKTITSGVIEVDDYTVIAQFKDATQALHSFCKSERNYQGSVITKSWSETHPLPEIFSLDFDVSCRPMGVRNSWLMRGYLSQLPEARAGNAFLKKWSKKSGVNNPIRGYLTSYAVTILWVAFLLRTGIVEYVDPEKIPILPELSQLDVPYIPLLRNPDNNDNDNNELSDISQCPRLEEMSERLAGLVVQFFRFYMEFPWENYVITLRDPKAIVSCTSLGWLEVNEVQSDKLRERVWYRMCIEDPYEDNLNLGRHLSPGKVAFVRGQFVLATISVLQGNPAHLLIDHRRLASETLLSLLHRAVLGDHIHSLTLSELREYVISHIGEEMLGDYELHNSLGSLHQLFMNIVAKYFPTTVTYTSTTTTTTTITEGNSRSQSMKNNTENTEVDKENNNNSNKTGGSSTNSSRSSSSSSKSSSTNRSNNNSKNNVKDTNINNNNNNNNNNNENDINMAEFLQKIDEKLNSAGRLGISIHEVPLKLQSVYFVTCGRIFRTAAERDLVQQHVEVLTNILETTSPITRKDIFKYIKLKLPTAIRDDALVNDLLIECSECTENNNNNNNNITIPHVKLAIQLQNTPAKVMVRKKSPTRRELKPLRPSGKPLIGICNDCKRKNIEVRGTSDHRRDNGVYCNNCWDNYIREEKAGRG